MILGRGIAHGLTAALWLMGWLPFWRSRHSLNDALAALAAAGLFVVAARRCQSEGPVPVSLPVLAVALLLAVAGVMAECTLPVALALVLVAGLGCRPEARRVDELRLLALLTLPWLATDGAQLALACRQSAAWATEMVFHTVGFDVVRDGTTLTIGRQPLAVAAACAGLDTLHITLVAGAWLAGVLRTRRFFWLGVVVLPALAWLANTTRVIVLGGVALTWGPDAAIGWFHDWGGLSVVVTMFTLAGGWVTILRRTEVMK